MESALRSPAVVVHNISQRLQQLVAFKDDAWFKKDLVYAMVLNRYNSPKCSVYSKALSRVHRKPILVFQRLFNPIKDP